MPEKYKVDRTFAVLKRVNDEADDGYVDGDPATRIALVWKITCDTWAFVRQDNAQRRLQRDVTKLVKNKEATGREKDLLDAKILRRRYAKT